jgi:Core-2/I-Branching enzyme
VTTQGGAVRRPGPVAVIVLSHRGPHQVQRLVDRLRTGDDVFVAVHHDPGGAPLALEPASNVALVPDPIRCRWGGYDLVLASWRALQWVSATVPELSWVLLISGQDYPAMPVTAIERELRASPRDAFLRHFRIDDDPALDVHPWQQLCRTRYLHRRRAPLVHKAIPWPRRHPFHDGFHAYAGDMWFNLSRDAVDQVLDRTDRATALLRFLQHAPIPDEMFIASLVCNEPGLDVVNDRRRYLRFERGARHPHTLGAADVPTAVSSDAFFARKLSEDTDPAALDELDRAAAAAGTSP